MSSAFNNKIELIWPSKKSTKKIDFEFKLDEPSVKDTFMCNFKDLKLSDHEKKFLSQQHRKEILAFKTIDHKQIKFFSQQLISYLFASKDDELIIRANHLGTYICLTAIFSGKIPPHGNWRFELSEAPLAFFPKELMTNKYIDEVDIIFELKSDCWLKPFKSLYSPPEYLPIFQRQNLTKQAA